ncbi:MAG: zf-HC2 domain-containing protein [candidate division KSB1 bacterium]|nr:zf-HC2 domain-containing protein [candidate division KSB1 bacterium]MDZ7364442.1 zf-HC2 domain-containing protein [candidate division KSB1 bacterium]MDZ7402814.1 zf-HC2 domain-containing protein [candidate division KSB1 bacterium]
MNCFEIEEYLLDYLDNELAGSMQQVVAEHLQMCLSCRKEVENYRKTTMLLQLRAVPEPAPAYWDATWEKIRAGFKARVLPMAGKPLPSPSRWLWLQRVNWRPLVGAAAMFLLILTAAIWSWQKRSRELSAQQAMARIYLNQASNPALWRDDNFPDDMSRQIELITASRAAFGSIDPISKSVTLVRLEANNK